jgi:hypothetical protein
MNDMPDVSEVVSLHFYAAVTYIYTFDFRAVVESKYL